MSRNSGYFTCVSVRFYEKRRWSQRGLWIFDKTVNSYRQRRPLLRQGCKRTCTVDVTLISIGTRRMSSCPLSLFLSVSLRFFLSLALVPVSDSVKRCEPRGEGNWMGQLSPVQSRRDKITKDYYIRYSASSLVCTWRTLEEIKGTCEWNLNLAAREKRDPFGTTWGKLKKGNCLRHRRALDLEKCSFFCIWLAVIFSPKFQEKFVNDGWNVMELSICFLSTVKSSGWRERSFTYSTYFYFTSSKCLRNNTE